MIVEDGVTRMPVAAFPAALAYDFALLPDCRSWTWAEEKYVYLVTLEGEFTSSHSTGGDWYFSIDRKNAQGPVTASQIQQLIATGQFSRDSLVSRDKNKWYLASNLRGVKWPIGQ